MKNRFFFFILLVTSILVAEDEEVARVIITPKGNQAEDEGNKEIVKKYFTALSKNNFSEVESLIHSQFTISQMGDQPSSTIAEFSSNLSLRFKSLHEAFPELSVKVESLIGEGNKVVARVQMSGSQKGPFMGIEPTSRPILIKKIEIFTIEDKKIVHIAEMWNSLEVMKQLGYIVL